MAEVLVAIYGVVVWGGLLLGIIMGVVGWAIKEGGLMYGGAVLVLLLANALVWGKWEKL